MLTDRLKHLRDFKGLTMKAVAEAIDEKPDTYRSYESGRLNPNYNVLVKLADFYNVSTDYLLGRDNSDPIDIEKQSQLMLAQLIEDYHKFPLEQRLEIVKKMLELIEDKEKRLKQREIAVEEYEEEIKTIFITFCRDKASAGPGEDISGESENPDRIKVIETDISRKADFAVRVDGDSMIPAFDDGDIALIAEGEADPGQIGLFEMAENGYIKKLGDGELISLNPKYDPIPIVPPMRCAGIVLGKAELPE